MHNICRQWHNACKENIAEQTCNSTIYHRYVSHIYMNGTTIDKFDKEMRLQQIYLRIYY